MPIRVHVACDHEIIRRSLAALLDSDESLDVIRTSPEGVRGLEAVRNTRADVLVLAVPPHEDIAQHADWYRQAISDAGIVGFAVTDEQAEGYRTAGIEEIIYSHNSTADLSQAIHRVAP